MQTMMAINECIVIWQLLFMQKWHNFENKSLWLPVSFKVILRWNNILYICNQKNPKNIFKTKQRHLLSKMQTMMHSTKLIYWGLKILKYKNDKILDINFFITVKMFPLLTGVFAGDVSFKVILCSNIIIYLNVI